MFRFLKLPMLLMIGLVLSGCDIIIEEEVYIAPEQYSGMILSVMPSTVRFNLVRFADEFGNPISVQGFDGGYQQSYSFPMPQARGFDPAMSAHYMEPGYYAIADIRNYSGKSFYSSEITPVEFDGNRFMSKWGAIYVPRGYMAYVGRLDFSTHSGRLTIEQYYDQRDISTYVRQLPLSIASRVVTGGYYPSGYFYRF
ncbi:hypothetical protein OAT84_02050 [Gammaproteobacteria bacterium]|nr:hypothetical protein [Gammaproteobacteria bacterium]